MYFMVPSYFTISFFVIILLLISSFIKYSSENVTYQFSTWKFIKFFLMEKYMVNFCKYYRYESTSIFICIRVYNSMYLSKYKIKLLLLCVCVCVYLLLLIFTRGYFSTFLKRESRREGEIEKEKHCCEKSIWIGCHPHTP